jgi:phosphate regulon transcriptional regulator PhoB
MKKILVIEDENDIVELLTYNLNKEGFNVDFSFDGETALNKINSNEYDLIILDLMLPGIQGLDLCKIIRNNPRTKNLPIIMLTAKSEDVDKIIGLEIGADDYITKPFNVRELIARIKAILRRVSDVKLQETISTSIGSIEEKILKIKDMTIDKEKYTVLVGAEEIKLTATEFKLLLFLAERRGKVYNRDQLLDAVWGTDIYIEPRTVDVHIRRLRSKIEKDPDNPQYIKTMRGIGYFIE